MNNTVLEFFITFFFGIFGVHKFLRGENKLGIIYLCTMGIFGIGWIYDLILIIIRLINEKGKHTYKMTSNKKNFFTNELNKINSENNTIFKDNYDMFKSNCCPNCGCVLENEIKTSKQCSECKERIIVRTNKFNKQKLVLTSKDLKKYEKYEKKLKEITFCEKYISAIDTMYPQYMNEFYKLKNEKPELSVRDYTFSFENTVAMYLDNEGFKEFNRGMKQKFDDRIYTCDSAINKLNGATNIYRFMTLLTEFEGRNDIVITSAFNLLYRSVNIAQLPYIYWEDRTFDKIGYYSTINTYGMSFIKDYIEKNNVTIESLKNMYLEYCGNFIFNLVSKEESWTEIVDSYYRYIKLIETNDINVYKS